MGFVTKFKEKLLIYEKYNRIILLVRITTRRMLNIAKNLKSLLQLWIIRSRILGRLAYGPKCFKCNNFGHKASNYPESSQTRATLSITPQPQQQSETFREVKLNGAKLVGLIDTGSFQ